MKHNRIIVLLLILLLLSTISFISYLYLRGITDIKVVELANGKFDINNKSFIFDLNNLKHNYSYNVVLRFYKNKNIDINKLINNKSIYTIRAELLDIDNNVVTSTEINKEKLIPGSYTDDYFEWHIMSFNYKKNINIFKFHFISDDRFYDLLEKELVVEKHYDPAAFPFLLLIRKALLIVSIISLLLTTLLYGLKLAKRE